MSNLESRFSEELKYLRENVFPKVSPEGEAYLIGILERLETEVELFENLNTPKDVIIAKWDPTECPTCRKDFFDYEPCKDGYYKRAYHLDRCPHCGQKLKWPW